MRRQYRDETHVRRHLSYLRVLRQTWQSSKIEGFPKENDPERGTAGAVGKVLMCLEQ